MLITAYSQHIGEKSIIGTLIALKDIERYTNTQINY